MFLRNDVADYTGISIVTPMYSALSHYPQVHVTDWGTHNSKNNA